MDLNPKLKSPQFLQSTAIPFADMEIHIGFNKIAFNFPPTKPFLPQRHAFFNKECLPHCLVHGTTKTNQNISSSHQQP